MKDHRLKQDQSEQEQAPLLSRNAGVSTHGSNSSSSSSVAINIGLPTTPPEIHASGSLRGTCCSPDGASSSSLARQNSSSCEPEAEVIGTCRICFESETTDSQDPANPLICPCMCSGGSKYVHRQCLQQWRETNLWADAFYQCEVCKYRYQYRRLWYAHLLGSQATLVLLFILIMSCCIFAMGFVPIVSGWGDSSSSSSSSSSGDSGSSGGSSPAPGGSGGDSSAAVMHIGKVVMHITNGIVMLGIVGLAASMMLAVARACGLPGLALVPDPWCPGCIFCLDFNGGSGLGWAPLLECSSVGECGVIMLGVAAVALVVLGIVMACYMLYGMLWRMVQAALGHAQQMVENVQQK